MNHAKRLLSMAVIGAVGAMTFTVGSSLVKDVQFARAEQKVEMEREQLATLDDLSSAFKKVNKVMEKSVVHVKVEKKGGMAGMDPETLRRFFGRGGELPDQDFNQEATGSGVIMDAANGEGFIVTNNHVVADAESVSIVLQDGRQIDNATVVGTDPKTDLALVKIKADRLIAANFGDSDKVEKGDLIVAFGSPFGYVGSMSHGIVSALNRQAGVISSSFAYENFIQVDAPINPGNSGGPLVNLKGQVIGINTAIATRSGSFSGIGFAIPSNQVQAVYKALKNEGKVVRGYLGVQIADVKQGTQQIRDSLNAIGFQGDAGVLVSSVLSNSPAFKILQPGDVITEINGKPIETMSDLRNRIALSPPGEEVKLTVWRDKKTQQLSVKLAEQPEEYAPQAAAREGMPNMAGLGISVSVPNAADLKEAGLPADAKGALVQQVMPGSAAARVGIQPGDLITRVGDTEITSPNDLRKALQNADFARGVRIDLLNREGEKMVTVRRPRGR